MFGFYSSFIGYPIVARNQRFHGESDSKEKYLKSLSEKPGDWEYRDLAISYVRNSNGHRSKEISDIDLTNYILCTGSSTVEGIGLPVEHRYSDVLANLLDTDVYNLALGGSGNDIIFYNLVTWFTTIKQKPKLVVINWVDELRYYTEKNKLVTVNGIWEEKNQEFMLTGDANGYFHTKTESIKQLTRKIIDVPIIEIPWQSTNNANEFNQEKECIVDLARDSMHPGIKSNKLLAEALYKHATT